MSSVLLVDDEKSFRVIAGEALAREGYSVRSAETGAQGMRLFAAEPADVVVLDRNLPDLDGVEVLARLSRDAQERGLDTLFLVATAYADVENAVLALRQGAEDYLTKPIQLPDLLIKIRKALETRRLRKRVTALRTGTPSAFFETRSAAMREALDRLRAVAGSPSTSVLLQGESGTGKEVVARLLHAETAGRSEEAFVELNCAALSESLLESELFGHERGAFTDAKSSKRGLLEIADGGTLFLDEIGELPATVQAKLLRVLETMTFRRVGGTRDLSTDVRIVAATNRDLAAEVTAGRFRLDLFHRLDVFHLTVPPLRDRREDIVALARHLLEHLAQRLARIPPQLSAEAEAALLAYPWPGNVPELRNALERALILERGGSIGPRALLLGPVTPYAAPAPTPAEVFFSLRLIEGRPPTLDELEKAYIERLLAHTGGNRTQAARLLGVSYPTIAKKITDLGITLP